MARLRVGVVLLIPPPVGREVDALRRAVGDGTYGRVPAHLTLVPPVNLNEQHLGDALRLLRDAGAATRPFTVHLGAPATFLPANPVLYLPLAGAGRAEVFALRERVFCEPLARPLTWPFVPHVTVADEVQPERITAAESALRDYSAEVTFDRVHLLHEGVGRVWRPVADAPFAAPAVVGRGSLPLELTVSHGLDPEARAFAALEQVTDTWGGGGTGELGLAVVGRRDGRVVGVGEGWAEGGAAHLDLLFVAPDARGEGIGAHVLAGFEAAAIDRGCRRLGTEVVADSPGDTFLRGRGWVEEGRRRFWRRGQDLVLLRRDR